MRLFFILFLAPMAAVALDLTDQQRADIEARIQPFSAICVQGETCGGGSDVMATSAGRSGEDVYNAACMACHSAGIAGAPKDGYAVRAAGRGRRRGVGRCFGGAHVAIARCKVQGACSVGNARIPAEGE